MNNTGQQRILFIDAARGLAVILALFGHSLFAFGPWSQLAKEQRIILSLFTHYATPSFIVLFGMMLELVYYPKLIHQGITSVIPRLLHRSLLCYVAYLVISTAWIIKNHLPLSNILTASLFLEKNTYTIIFKFWTIALLFAILLLIFRQRRGIAITIIVGSSPWLFLPVLDLIHWPDRSNPLAHLTSFMFGRPTQLSPISLFHSTPLIMVGMLLGHILRKGIRENRWSLFYGTIGLILLMSFSILMILCLKIPPMALLSWYQSRLRYFHHIGYYALGLIEALIGLLLLSWLIPPKTQSHHKLRPLFVFGRSSLLAYTLGNLILIAWPVHARISLFRTLIYDLVIVSCITVVLLIIDAIKFKEREKGKVPITEKY